MERKKLKKEEKENKEEEEEVTEEEKEWWKKRKRRRKKKKRGRRMRICYDSLTPDNHLEFCSQIFETPPRFSEYLIYITLLDPTWGQTTKTKIITKSSLSLNIDTATREQTLYNKFGLASLEVWSSTYQEWK